MSNLELNSPICLFIYNRPNLTKEVFEQIAAVEPTKLYVVADGPSEENTDDRQKCKAARRVTDEVDWSCEVHRNYSENNQGVKERFVTGLDWLFKHEKEAIILEDDCIPHLDFFKFCDKMLHRYRDDERIWDITGTNYLHTWKSSRQDYHFSQIGGIWGWATWRRSWEEYDPDMELWENDEVKARLQDVLGNDSLFAYAETIYDRTYRGQVETWDYPWGFAKQINSGLSVVPAKNLVSNVGFEEKATHTTEEASALADIPRHNLEFPFQEPPCVAVDRDYDLSYLRQRTSLWERVPVVRRITNKILMEFRN